MKKFLCLILAVMLLVSFVSCGSCGAHGPDDDDTRKPTVSSDTTGKTDANPNESEPSDTTAGDTTSNGTLPGDTTSSDQTTSDTLSSSEGDGNTEKVPEGDVDNDKVKMLGLLTTLLEEYFINPKSSLPITMIPEYAGNQIDKDDVITDYSQNISASKIPQNGMGQQWNMVVENIYESQMFFNVLTAVDGIATASVAAFNNYLDENPSDTAHHTFESGIYSVTIKCTKDTIYYVLEYEADLPVLGKQSIQIALSMDIETEVKNVRVQIGDANALAYTVTKDGYTFAIKLLDVRRAYFELNKNSDNSYTGHVYEYLTVGDIEFASVADFYITNDYVTVIGNKADGIVGFDNYICELYSVRDGKMLAYEVMETAEVLGVEVTYNTLWFDLEHISGITSVKYAPDSNDDGKEKFFINGSNSPWIAKKYGLSGGAKAASRRFDIEFRTQYFYYYDAENEKYEKVSMEIPMLFVQEEVYSSLTSDVRSENGITVSVTLNDAYLTKLKSEYSLKTENVVEGKDKYSVEKILQYIGNRVVIE